LINHDFEKEALIPILKIIRTRFPKLWIGLNFLAVTGKDAFPILGALAAEGCPIDAYWADDARINETGDNIEAEEIAKIRETSGWKGLYFGGTAFKKQREVAPEEYSNAAKAAMPFMDVITTSGIATGEEAFMVATGINEPGNFYDIDPARLAALMEQCRHIGKDQTDETN